MIIKSKFAARAAEFLQQAQSTFSARAPKTDSSFEAKPTGSGSQTEEASGTAGALARPADLKRRAEKVATRPDVAVAKGDDQDSELLHHAGALGGWISRAGGGFKASKLLKDFDRSEWAEVASLYNQNNNLAYVHEEVLEFPAAERLEMLKVTAELKNLGVAKACAESAPPTKRLQLAKNLKNVATLGGGFFRAEVGHDHLGYFRDYELGVAFNREKVPLIKRLAARGPGSQLHAESLVSTLVARGNVPGAHILSVLAKPESQWDTAAAALEAEWQRP